MTAIHQPVFLLISNDRLSSGLIKSILLEKNAIVKTATTKNINKFNYPDIHYIIFISQNNKQQTTSPSDIINIYDLAKKHNSKLAVIDILEDSLDLRSTEAIFQLLSQIAAGKPLFRYLITKDIFQTANDKAVFAFERHIKQIITNGGIDVSIKGDSPIYPLELSDLLAAVLKSLFIEDTAGEKLTFIGDPLNDLDFAYLIKQELEKVSRTIDINTTKTNRQINSAWFNNSANTRALVKWLPKDTTEEQLAKKILLLINSKTQENTVSLPIEIKHPQKEKQKVKFVFPKIKISRRVARGDSSPEKSLHQQERKLIIIIPLIILAIIIFSLISISLIWFGVLNISINKTNQSLQQLKIANIDKSKKNLITAQRTLDTAYQIEDFLLPAYRAISPNLARKSSNLESFLKHLQSVIESVQESYTISENLYSSLFTQSGNNSSLDLTLALQSRLRTILQELSQLKIISQKKLTFKPIAQKLKELNFLGRIVTLENQTSQSLKLLEPFSVLLSSTKPQQIAVIVQDPYEIKNTGGRIRLLVIAGLDKQKLVNIYPLSPTQVNKKLLGQILAPTEISKLTGKESLQFEDANYSPDFPQSAQSIQKFLINSQNINPALVMAVNTSIFTDVLKELGQINVQGETLTKDIFATQLLQEIQANNISPTLNNLIINFIERLRTQSIPLVKLARPLINAVTQDNLRLWFSDPKMEKTIFNQSFSGIISPSTCHPLLSNPNCLLDTVSFNENNYTVYPLNYYQDRHVQDQITISKQGVKHVFFLKYQYKENTPIINRDYQALYQIYLNPAAQFIKIEKNNREVKLDIVKEKNKGLSFFQIPLAHKTGETTTIKIFFWIPFSSPNFNLSQTAYTLKTYHQSGVNPDKYQTIINFPNNLSISTSTAAININDGKVIYQPSTGQTSILGLQFRGN